MIIQFNFDEAQLVALIKNAAKEAMAELPGQSEPPDAERQVFYSIKSVANFLNMCPATVQKLKNQGRLPYRQIGRKVIFDSLEIMNSMEPRKGKGIKNGK